ncbi:MAG: hypothetical protein AB1429_16430 [Pseudomonadota bacterium]
MAGLDADIAAYDRMRSELEARHPQAWVLFHRGLFIDAFDDFEAAATVAVERFDHGPYLIRQVGAGAVLLPGGLVFRPKHALDTGGLQKGRTSRSSRS